MIIHLKIIGILLMILALIHIPFPKYFSWKKELQSLSLINRQMMQTHTFFIALTVFLIGFLSFSSTSELINNAFGRQIALGLAIFWLIRLFFQFFVYSPKLWKGKAFETVMHIVFSFLWIYLVLIFGNCYFRLF
jgi:hypothetical protein